MSKSSVLALNLAFILIFPVFVLSQDKTDFAALLRLGPKQIAGLELGTPSPNELKGLEFTREGKLEDLRLGISTIADVGRLFGNCADVCKYDSKWNVVFHYFSESSAYTTRFSSGQGQPTVSRTYVPRPEYIGKLKAISIVPRKRILFDKITVPDDFYQSLGSVSGHGFDGSASVTLLKTYTDGYGLRYSVVEEDRCTRCKQRRIRQKGELISIEYTIPKHLEEKMFVEHEKP